MFYLIQFIFISFLYYNIFKKYNFNFNFNLILKQFKYAIPVGFTSAIGIITINIDNNTDLVGSYYSKTDVTKTTNSKLIVKIVNLLKLTKEILDQF